MERTRIARHRITLHRHRTLPTPPRRFLPTALPLPTFADDGALISSMTSPTTELPRSSGSSGTTVVQAVTARVDCRLGDAVRGAEPPAGIARADAAGSAKRCSGAGAQGMTLMRRHTSQSAAEKLPSGGLATRSPDSPDPPPPGAPTGKDPGPPGQNHPSTTGVTGACG